MYQPEEVYMKNSVRLSIELPIDEHIYIKMECARARISMKDFLHAVITASLTTLKEKRLMERLKKSIQQAKEGKVTTMSLSELEKFVEDEQ